MYALDGVPLQNPALGWRFKRTSEPWIGRSLDRPDFNTSNRDGTIRVRGHVTTPTFALTVTAPHSSVEALRRLLRLGGSLTRVDDPGVALGVQMVSMSHVTITPAGGEVHEVTAVYRAPEVWWRDVNTNDWTSTIPTHSGAGSATMNVLTSTTGAVQDALVLVEGGGTGLTVAGRAGTYMRYNQSIWQQWVRFDAAAGKAWFGTQGDGNEWTGGSDATGNLDTGAYPYFLELYPDSTGAPGALLTVSWASITMPTTVTVRAKNAYDR